MRSLAWVVRELSSIADFRQNLRSLSLIIGVGFGKFMPPATDQISHFSDLGRGAPWKRCATASASPD